MSNLPDRLGDSDTSALLKHGRAYGVAAAIAVGAIAYMSGGISGVEMGGAVAATAPAPAASDTTYTNRPSNLTGFTLVYHNDGTSVDQSGEGWDVQSGWDSTHVVSTDVASPINTASVIKVVHPALSGAAAGAGFVTVDDFANLSGVTAGAYEEIYTMYRIQVVNADTIHGQKLFYMGMDSLAIASGIGHYFTTREGAGTSLGNLKFEGDVGGENILFNIAGAWSGKENAWAALEHQYVAESSNGAGDGILNIWLDGANIVSDSTVGWSNASLTGRLFGGFDWYDQVSLGGITDPRHTSHYLGEFYMIGKKAAN